MSRILGYAARLPDPIRRTIKKLPGARTAQARLAGAPAGRLPRPGEVRPVVYLPTWARWDEMRQRPQYVLSAFARAGHDVYFVDPREATERVADGVRIVPSLTSVPGAHVILYVHFAPLVEMFSSFTDAVVVYDILDDLSIYDADEIGIPEERRVRSYHPRVVELADVVVASAPSLVATHESERDDILLVQNGVEPDRFRGSHPRPSQLEGIREPIIGYHGAIARWFDFDLLRGAILARPDLQFVTVGPVDDDASAHVAELAEFDNFHTVAAVPSDEIPGFVAAFDVGIVPFVVDDLTRGVSPLKMYEYLAARVPVVSTPLPVCESHPEVRTAASVESFVEAIDEALADRKSEAFAAKADAAADAASWDSRIASIRQRLDELHLLKVRS